MGGKDGIKDQRFVIDHAGDAEYSLVTRSSDGQMLFLVSMLSKMKQGTKLGSRIAEVHNGSSLFTGDAGQGESNIRRWIIESDWLEAIVALPLNMFYNTGIATYIWLLTNRKPAHRSYRVEKKAAIKIQLPDLDAEIEPVPTAGGGHKPEPELDRLSNILKVFNDQFGNIPWTDSDRVHMLITEDIPNRVAADKAYQNAKQNSDKQNARIEHDKALARVMTAVLKDDTELFKQFMDNEGFRRWLTDTVFGITFERPSP
jgi:hypothetical protein